jgi:hypothetical protein
MKGKLMGLAASIMTASALAGPVLTFDGVCDYGLVQGYYAGGTDSCGNSGPNYGIYFNGGRVRYGDNGAFLEGASRVSFDTHADLSQISFQGYVQAFRWGAFSYALANDYRMDAVWIDDAGFKWYNLPSDHYFTMYGNGQINGLELNTMGMDNLTFKSDSWTAISPVIRAGDPTELPEPGALMTLSIGAVILARMRRA